MQVGCAQPDMCDGVGSGEVVRSSDEEATKAKSPRIGSGSASLRLASLAFAKRTPIRCHPNPSAGGIANVLPMSVLKVLPMSLLGAHPGPLPRGEGAQAALRVEAVRRRELEIHSSCVAFLRLRRGHIGAPLRVVASGVPPDVEGVRPAARSTLLRRAGRPTLRRGGGFDFPRGVL